MMDKVNFSCVPMYNQFNNQLLAYACSTKNMENFQNSKVPDIFNQTTVYQKNDIVFRDNKAYVMIDGIGAAGAGYGPPRPNNWALLNYDNGKVYKVGDFVNGPDGIIYKMIDGIGAAGYAPPRPTNWMSHKYDNDKVYKVGDIVAGSDGKTYRMIDGIGAAGYAPPRPTNWKAND